MGIFLYGFLMLFFIIFFIFLLGMYLLSTLLGGLGNVWNLLRKLTGWGTDSRTHTAKSSSSAHASSRSSDAGTSRRTPPPGNHHRGEKMFGDNEGTYVDFEEVKES